MVEKKLKEQELAYHDHNRPMEVTLMTSAVSKHVTELKVHASYLPVNHHQQVGPSPLLHCSRGAQHAAKLLGLTPSE